MLDAALNTFAEKGYGQATTREIAARAGVTETLLFRHFTTKQALFETAVLEPPYALLEEFTGPWGQDPLHDEPAALLERFVSGVYDRCHEQRKLLLALPMEEISRPIPQAMFERLERMADAVSERFGFGYDS